MYSACSLPASRSARGLSLVELIISLALGMGLSLLIVDAFHQGLRGATREEVLARMRENGRFAATLLRRELEHAAMLHHGPLVPEPASLPVAIDCAAGNWALDTALPLDVINGASEPLRSAGGRVLTCLGPVHSRNGVSPGTDVIALKRVAADATVKNGSLVGRARETQWYLRSEGDVREWAYVGSSGRFEPGVVAPGNGVDMREYYARLFYIRSWSQRPGDGIPSLCIEQLSGSRMSTECVVEGVEDLQVELGLDTDGDGVVDSVTANPGAADLSLVVRAEYFLLLRSIDTLPGAGTGGHFQLGAKAVYVPEDGYHRERVSGVVQLVNLAARPPG